MPVSKVIVSGIEAKKDYTTVGEKLMFGKVTPEEAYAEIAKIAKDYESAVK
jgi:hypothetical protein